MQATNGILWFFPSIITGTFLVRNERECIPIGENWSFFFFRLRKQPVSKCEYFLCEIQDDQKVSVTPDDYSTVMRGREV